MTFAEILSDISPDRPYNLHSHTQFCDGRATMAQFAAAAAAEGMTHYGFSPHSPIPVRSTCNMTKTAVLEYLAECQRLKEEYAGRVKILASMEIDYLGEQWGPAIDYFRSLPLDYRIGSVHFIPNQQGVYYDIDGSPERFARYLAEGFGGDLRYVVDTYFAQSMAMVAAGGFDIIGHLDKIGYNASTVDPDILRCDWYEDKVRALIAAVAARGIAIEINTKARATTGRFFPDISLLPLVKASGAAIVVNSDAHYPNLISASRAEAIRLLFA